MAVALHKPSSVLIISVFLLFFFFPSSLSIRCLSHESQALLRFKAAFVASWVTLSSWVNGTDCCTSWSGISCDNQTNHVVSAYIAEYSFQTVISESLCELRFLTSLTILNLSPNKVGASGTTIPPCLGNLSYMQSLNLFGNGISGIIPPSLCLLTRLRVLDLPSNNLNGNIPPCLCWLTHLTILNLAYNNLNGSIPSCLGNLSSLSYLGFSENQLRGSIPASLGNLSYLLYLSLYDNSLSGSIPASLGSLSWLRYLYLHYNQLSGIIPNSLGNLSLLQKLVISYNQLSGTIPSSFSQLSALFSLYADGNHFNETISSSSLPPSLVELSLSLNYYQSVSETFFHKLTRLNKLYLSNCMLNISKTWIPTFQLSELSLVSCGIKSEFPPWISTQFSLERLELTNASLVGIVPHWIGETSSLLNHLNLSGNHLEGSLSLNNSIAMHLEELDLSTNGLSGCIPSVWPSNISILLLNDNKFNGNIPPSPGKLSQLWLLNLANNNLTGVIPASLSNCFKLIVLNLGNNNLEGSLPHEFNKLSELSSLVVHNNTLKGSFLSSVQNCSKLQVLDIGNNLFGGEIPVLIGNLSNLRVLVMKENRFIGTIPSEIGQLKNLQILLLSSNYISGSIPHTITSLQAMTNESQDGFVLITYGGSYKSKRIYKDPLDMTSKGRDEHYTYILSTLTSIDLSNNELEGEIAFDFGNLKGLRFLNLSMNNMNGTIPSSLGGISQLESLDLSCNKFSGQIPVELDFLNSLGFLNLSNNHLSGSIPQGRHVTTFNESSFSKNPNLWGCPLPKNCSWPNFVLPPPIPIYKEKKSTKYSWYGIMLGLSYGAAFGGIVSLILIKMNWRKIYFNKVDIILKFLFPWIRNLKL